MANYLIVLPPSQGKTKGGSEELPFRLVENLSKYNSFKELNNLRSEIYELLLLTTSQEDETKLEKIFDVKGKNLHYVVDNVQDMLNLPTMPAIKRFSGTMFKAIDYQNMPLHQRTNFEENVIFLDGMFGLIKPLDYLPEYKLKISSKFSSIDCTKFWKQHLQHILKQITYDKIVIDLLPQDHRKAMSVSNHATHLKVIFAKLQNGKYKEEGHASKQLKGELIKYVCERESISRDFLEKFVHSKGHKYAPEYSNQNTLIFLDNS